MNPRLLVNVCIVLSGSIALALPLGAQSPAVKRAAARVEASSSVPMVFDGLVLDPDGRAASGAVVASSAGGQTITKLDGSYRLEVQVPVEAERVQITAVTADGSGSQTVDTTRGPFASAGITHVDPLALTAVLGCDERWLPTFGQPTMDNSILAFALFDDGDGPALYAGGVFTTAGGLATNRIARRDADGWSALGSGMAGGPFGVSSVSALAGFDDGSGPALYAGGNFTTAGGVPASCIASWDGASWSALGSGVNDDVRALAVFDDGSGPALYAGGDFTTAGGVPASAIARWNGASWSALGSGMAGGTSGPRVWALAVFDDGDGPALYAGGEFTTAGGVAAKRIAKWDGSSWTPLGSGMNSSSVQALAVFDDGAGAALYAGGGFTIADGSPGNRIAKWDGSSWTPLGSGMSNFGVAALTTFDDGSGSALYACGSFTTAGGAPANRVARWDGSSWAALGSGMTSSTVSALAAFDAGDGPVLHAGGGFTVAGGVPAEFIATWNGSSWASLGTGLNKGVSALAVFDDGGGPTLYAGGSFTLAGALPVSRIARRDGSTWAPLGSGLSGANPLRVDALAVFDDGSGPALYVGGSFWFAGGVLANHIAKWDGSTWSAIGGVTSPLTFPQEGVAWVAALAVFDDGSGPALYVGGNFTKAGGVPANHIAKWDGSSWSPLAAGMNDSVNALAVFDDGSGPVLVSGSNGGPHYIAQWDGFNWSPMHGGMDFWVKALTVFDDGTGPALYAGGWFTTAGGLAADQIARWDGSDWSPLGSGMDNNGYVTALTAFDDGGGPALYAGGGFTTAGGQSAQRIAKWDGSAWTALGSGTNGDVLALTVFDDGNGPDLYAGGSFGRAFDSGDSYLAKWGCFPTAHQGKIRKR